MTTPKANILLKVVFILLTFTLSAQAQNKNFCTEKSFLLDEVDGKYGLIDVDGNQILESKYRSITPVYGSKCRLCQVKSAELGIFDLEKRQWLVRGIGEIKAAKAGLIHVRKNNLYGTISLKNFKFTIPIEYNQIRPLGSDAFVLTKDDELYFWYRDRDKEEFLMDETFKEIIPLGKYNADRYMLINKREAILFDRRNSEVVRSFKNFQDVKMSISNTIFIKDGGQWFITESNQISDIGYDDFKYLKSSLGTLVKKDDKWGVATKQDLNSRKIPTQYDSIALFNYDTYTIFSSDNKVGVIDKNNKILVPPLFQGVLRSNNSYPEMYFVKADSQYTRYDSTNMVYQTFDSIFDGYVSGEQIVSRNKLFGLYDINTDEILIEPKYDSAQIIFRNDRKLDYIYFYSNNNRWLYRKSGDKIYDKPIDTVKMFVGYSAVLLLPSGELILPADNGEIEVPSDARVVIEPCEFYTFKTEDKYQFVRVGDSGEELRSNYYDNYSIEYKCDFNSTHKSIFRAFKDNKWSWLDASSFEPVYPFIFDTIEEFNGIDSTQVVIDGVEKILFNDGTIKD